MAMTSLDKRLNTGHAYWDRWIAGTETRAPRLFEDEAADTMSPLPSISNAFEALMCTNYPVLNQRLNAIFVEGSSLPPFEQPGLLAHGEACLWWFMACEKTAPGRGAFGRDQAFLIARYAIEHFEQQGVIEWGAEPIVEEHDTWLFHRDSPSFWNALTTSLKHELHRNCPAWEPERSTTVAMLHHALEQGYAPWDLLNRRSTWWWTEKGEVGLCAEDHRAESTLAMQAWHWALTHEGPPPPEKAVSQSLTVVEGCEHRWEWCHLVREVERFNTLGWTWAGNHDGTDPVLQWLEVGRARGDQSSEHQALLIAWEGKVLRRDLPLNTAIRPRARL